MQWPYSWVKCSSHRPMLLPMPFCIPFYQLNSFLLSRPPATQLLWVLSWIVVCTWQLWRLAFFVRNATYFRHSDSEQSVCLSWWVSQCLTVFYKLIMSFIVWHLQRASSQLHLPHGLSHQWWEKDSETENRKYWKCWAVEIFLQACPFKLKLSGAHRPTLLNSFHCSHLVLLYNLDINIKYIHLHMSCFWGRYKSNQAALVFWLLL